MDETWSCKRRATGPAADTTVMTQGRARDRLLVTKIRGRCSSLAVNSLDHLALSVLWVGTGNRRCLRPSVAACWALVPSWSCGRSFCSYVHTRSLASELRGLGLFGAGSACAQGLPAPDPFFKEEEQKRRTLSSWVPIYLCEP